MNKSANQRWKESGTTLSFKEWIEREKQKFNYQSDDKKFVGADGSTDVSTTPSSATVPSSLFGINSTVLILSGVIILGATGYYLYKKLKK
jgi:hypothetical protein